MKNLRQAIGWVAIAIALGGWANYNPSGDIQAYVPGGGASGGNPNGAAAGNVDWLGFTQTSSTGPVKVVAPNGGGFIVVGNANATGNLAVNGNTTLGTAATNWLQLGAGTRALAPADGTFQLTSNANSFGSILLGAPGALTGAKLVSSASSLGILTLSAGDGTSSAQLAITGVAGTTAISAVSQEADLGEVEIRRATGDTLRLRSAVNGRLSSNTQFGWSSGDAGSVSRDTTLYRDSAGVVGLNAGASNTATGSFKAAGFNFGIGTLTLSGTDGVFQVTKSDGTFGTLLLGATGATTGMRFTGSNGQMTLSKGDASTGAQLVVSGGSIVAGVVNSSGTFVGAGNSAGVYGGGGNSTQGAVTFPSTSTGPVAFLKATGTLTGSAFTFDGNVQIQGGGSIRSGSLTPNSNVTGSVGDIYLWTGGAAGTTFWVKETGTGNTGWVSK